MEQLSHLVGQTLTEDVRIDLKNWYENVNVIYPSSEGMITGDMRYDRVNVYVNEENVITAITKG